MRIMLNKSLSDIREEFSFVNGHGTKWKWRIFKTRHKFSPNAILINALSDLAQKNIYKTVF